MKLYRVDLFLYFTKSFKSRIVLRLEKEKFSKFLNELTSQSENGKEKKLLISFALSLKSIRFDNVIGNLQKESLTFFFGQKPVDSQSVVAVDSLLSFNEYGENRTELSQSQIEKWKNIYKNNLQEIDLEYIPLFFGGMKFSPEGNSDNSIWSDYSDSDWFIPKLLFINVKEEFYAVFNFVYKNNVPELIHEFDSRMLMVESFQRDVPHSDKEVVQNTNMYDVSERTEWIKKVNAALEEIADGDYSKIVLSRRVELTLSKEPNIFNKLVQLSEDYPKCYVFAYRKNESVFFGASPEKLARIKDGWVEADALAGSTQRGETEDEDERLADELLLSKKNLSEQNAVVNFITKSFSGFAEEIIYDEKPIIRKLSNIQHLWTPIKAKLKSAHTIFSILKEIHPTPAICGVPWSGALDFIKTTEGYNRGLYAGIIGWFNFDEQGEFAVSIRSGLLKENKLFAFAGCGIVEGSDPETEFEETELKLKPILSLFPDEKVIQS